MSDAMKATWSTLTSRELVGCEADDLRDFTNSLNVNDGGLRCKMLENPGDLPSVLDTFSSIVQKGEDMIACSKLTTQTPIYRLKLPKHQR